MRRRRLRAKAKKHARIFRFVLISCRRMKFWIFFNLFIYFLGGFFKNKYVFLGEKEKKKKIKRSNWKKREKEVGPSWPGCFSDSRESRDKRGTRLSHDKDMQKLRCFCVVSYRMNFKRCRFSARRWSRNPGPNPFNTQT